MEAEEAFTELLKGAADITQNAVKAVLNGSEDSVTVFNSLSFGRKALVTLPEAFATGRKRQTAVRVPVQVMDGTVKALVELPSCGAVALIPATQPAEPEYIAAVTEENPASSVTETEDGFLMENTQIRACVKQVRRGDLFILKESGRGVCGRTHEPFPPV